MTRIRRGGYIFVTWIGDHEPRNVHVMDGVKFVLKWNLETDEPMEGVPTRKIQRLIRELIKEGRL